MLRVTARPRQRRCHAATVRYRYSAESLRAIEVMST